MGLSSSLPYMEKLDSNVANPLVVLVTFDRTHTILCHSSVPLVLKYPPGIS